MSIHHNKSVIFGKQTQVRSLTTIVLIVIIFLVFILEWNMSTGTISSESTFNYINQNTNSNHIASSSELPSPTTTALSDLPSEVTPTTMYAISITGMQLKNIWCYPKFYWYAVPALHSAQNFKGNIMASTNACYLPNARTGTDHHTLMTLTVWDNRTSTKSYVATSVEHRNAMKQMKLLNQYAKFYHYESDVTPTWEEAKELWKQYGKEY